MIIRHGPLEAPSFTAAFNGMGPLPACTDQPDCGTGGQTTTAAR